MSLIGNLSTEKVAAYYCCSAPSSWASTGIGASWRDGGHRDKGGEGGRVRAARRGRDGKGRRNVDRGGDGAVAVTASKTEAG